MVRSKPVKSWSVFILLTCLENNVRKIALVLNKREIKDDQKAKKKGWGLPGGGVQQNEIFANGFIDLNKAIARELEEETGINFNQIDISPNFTNRDLPYFCDKKDHNDSRLNSRVVVLYGKLKEPVPLHPQPESDVLEARWFTEKEIQQLIKKEEIYQSHLKRIKYILSKI